MTYRLADEDAESFHVKHPDGSVISVPKKTAPEHILDAIRYLPKMADGGEVRTDTTSTGRRVAVTNETQPVNVQGTPAEPKENPAAMRRLLAKVAEPQRMDVGGLAGNPAPGEPVETDPLSPWQQFNLGAENSQVADTARIAQEAATPADALIPPFMRQDEPKPYPAPPPAGAQTTDQTPATGAGMLERPPDQPEQQQGAPIPFPELPGYPGAKLQAGIDTMLREGRAGAQQQAQAQAQQAQEQTKIYSDYQAGLQGIQSRWQSAHTDAANEYANAIADVKSARVDPSRFWSTRSTGQKISATIGMILGGIGSGLTGQPNAALQVIDRAIDRDIDAQKANIHQGNNLVSMLYQKLGSVDAAANAARMYLYGDVSAKVGLATARAGTLQAQATGKLLESHLQAQALGPMAQMINGSYQAQLQRYQMEWQRRMWSMMGQQGQQQGQGYVPSVSAPVFTGDPAAHIKSTQEQRIDWTDGQGNRRFSFGKPGQAKDANEQLTEISLLRNDANELKTLANKATTGLLPWSAVRAKWDVLQGNFALASPRALGGVNRMNDNELKIGKETTGDTIWKTKLNGGAALDQALALIQKRQDAILRSQGVDERYLGAGGPQTQSYLTAPAR